MKKNNLKLNILIILSLCFMGLIVFSVLYLLNKNNLQKNIHLSNPIKLDFFETAFKFNKKELNLIDKNIVAGIIPHHLLAADLIAEFFYNLQNKGYETIVLIGPNHFNTGESDIISSQYNWQTPYGILECDQKLLKELKKLDEIKIEEDIIKNEHSINSEVSFIKKIFPQAKIVPIILKSNINEQQATALSDKLFELSKNKKILILVSVDFSHYQDNLTAQNNDQVSINAIDNFDFDKIYNLEIDSPASIYTLLRYSYLNEANFELLNNSNSALLSNKLDLESTTSYVTGYFTKQNNSNLLENKESLRMLFFGDLMLDRQVEKEIEQNGMEYILGKLKTENFLDNYDLIGANLEGVVTNDGKYYYPERGFDFAFKPEIVNELKEYNFNFFNLANNHFDDQGTQGINEAHENLDRMGFDYVGCRNGLVNNCSSKIIELKNKKIGMVGLSVFWDKFDLEKAKQVIAELKSQTDLVIVNVHWGEEYITKFNSWQQKMAYDFVDAGADLILGHHPHVVQGIEIYKDRPIFYSLGNFVFDQYFSEETQKGLAVELTLNDENLNFKLHPFKSKASQVELMTSTEKDNFLQEIFNRSVIDEQFANQVRVGIFTINN